MLKVDHFDCNLSDARDLEIIIDFYVPVTVEIGDQSSFEENMVYWRTGNLSTSLIEIGIGDKTGKLRRFVLTAAPHARLGQKGIRCPHNEVGRPIFDRRIFEVNHCVDFKNEFSTYLSRDQLQVFLDEKQTVEKMLTNQRFCLGLNRGDEIICILITNLTDEEYAELQESLIKVDFPENGGSR